MSMRGELEQKIQELQATVIKLKDQLMELGGIIDHHLELPTDRSRPPKLPHVDHAANLDEILAAKATLRNPVQ